MTTYALAMTLQVALGGHQYNAPEMDTFDIPPPCYELLQGGLYQAMIAGPSVALGTAAAVYGLQGMVKGDGYFSGEFLVGGLTSLAIGLVADYFSDQTLVAYDKGNCRRRENKDCIYLNGVKSLNICNMVQSVN